MDSMEIGREDTVEDTSATDVISEYVDARRRLMSHLRDEYLVARRQHEEQLALAEGVKAKEVKVPKVIRRIEAFLSTEEMMMRTQVRWWMAPSPVYPPDRLWEELAQLLTWEKALSVVQEVPAAIAQRSGERAPRILVDKYTSWWMCAHHHEITNTFARDEQRISTIRQFVKRSVQNLWANLKQQEH